MMPLDVRVPVINDARVRRKLSDFKVCEFGASRTRVLVVDLTNDARNNV